MSRPSQPELPGRRGYQVVGDDLHRRWKSAETRALLATRTAEREEAEAELDACWKAVLAWEDEGRDLAAEAQFEREHES